MRTFSRAGTAVLLTATMLMALAACGQGEDPQETAPTSSHLPDTDAPEEEHATRLRLPSRASAGETIEIQYEFGEVRGYPYYLDHWTEGRWTNMALLEAKPVNSARPPSFMLPGDPNYGWLDLAFGGAGEDLLLLPPQLPPGDYRICSANSPEQRCGRLQIVAPKTG